MKKFVFAMIAVLSSMCMMAQDENPVDLMPTYNVTINRMAVEATVDGKQYEDVKVDIKAPSQLLSKEGVKVTILNSKGKKLFSKVLPKSLLYNQSNDKVVVAKKIEEPYLVLQKNQDDGSWTLVFNEKGIK